MIDERNRGGAIVRHSGGFGGRLGESLPDYEDVKVSGIKI